MLSGKSGTAYQDTEIVNDGFWPNLNAGDFEKRRGVPAEMNKETIACAVVAAIGQVNLELKEKKAEYQEKGIATAADADEKPSIAGKNLIVILYENAVFARAKADLLPEYATQQSKDAGDRVAESEPETRNSLLTESQQHLRAIKGKGRVGIELI